MRAPKWLIYGALLLSVGCKSNSSPTSPSTNPATLNVVVKDTPFTDATALLVTFSTVSVHVTGGDFVTLPFAGGASSRTCDLKKLTGAEDVLGTGPLATGHYTQVRLVVSSAAIYFDNASSTTSACASSITAPAGRTAAVDVPSGEVILNQEFDITATAATTMVLDFNGDQSVVATGSGRYIMKPVITVVSVH